LDADLAKGAGRKSGGVTEGGSCRDWSVRSIFSATIPIAIAESAIRSEP
jgi:hypothetical protein